jgi:hypothetical protein
LADAIRIGVGGGCLTRVLGFADRPMDALGADKWFSDKESGLYGDCVPPRTKREWLWSARLASIQRSLYSKSGGFLGFPTRRWVGDLARIRTPTISRFVIWRFIQFSYAADFGATTENRTPLTRVRNGAIDRYRIVA